MQYRRRFLKRSLKQNLSDWRRIISDGQLTPEDEWYDEDENEWFILLKGSAGLLLEGDKEPLVLKPGDYLNLPAHRRHKVLWTDADEKTIWLALHYK